VVAKKQQLHSNHTFHITASNVLMYIPKGWASLVIEKQRQRLRRRGQRWQR